MQALRSPPTPQVCSPVGAGLPTLVADGRLLTAAKSVEILSSLGVTTTQALYLCHVTHSFLVNRDSTDPFFSSERKTLVEELGAVIEKGRRLFQLDSWDSVSFDLPVSPSSLFPPSTTRDVEEQTSEDEEEDGYDTAPETAPTGGRVDVGDMVRAMIVKPAPIAMTAVLAQPNDPKHLIIPQKDVGQLVKDLQARGALIYSKYLNLRHWAAAFEVRLLQHMAGRKFATEGQMVQVVYQLLPQFQPPPMSAIAVPMSYGDTMDFIQRTHCSLHDTALEGQNLLATRQAHNMSAARYFEYMLTANTFLYAPQPYEVLMAAIIKGFKSHEVAQRVNSLWNTHRSLSLLDADASFQAEFACLVRVWTYLHAAPTSLGRAHDASTQHTADRDGNSRGQRHRERTRARLASLQAENARLSALLPSPSSQLAAPVPPPQTAPAGLAATTASSAPPTPCRICGHTRHSANSLDECTTLCFNCGGRGHFTTRCTSAPSPAGQALRALHAERGRGRGGRGGRGARGGRGGGRSD
jgi:hypothetical protein